MSDKNVNLETTFEKLSFTQPSEDYADLGAAIIRQNTPAPNYWNARLSAAISALLFLSIALNLIQSAERNQGEPNELALTMSREMQTTDITSADSIFRFLCFTKTRVAGKGSPIGAELKGFGEWILFETSDNYQVTLSLLPLREWKPIGEFEDGIIEVQLDEVNTSTLHGVGMGPSSIKRGGPFPVYGNIRKLTASAAASTQTNSPTNSAQNANRNAAGIRRNFSSSSIGNIVAGVDSELSPLTQKYFGELLTSGECG